MNTRIEFSGPPSLLYFIDELELAIPKNLWLKVSMRKLAACVSSADRSEAAEARRAIMCADYVVRFLAPLGLETAGLKELATELRNLPPIIDAASAEAGRELAWKAYLVAIANAAYEETADVVADAVVAASMVIGDQPNVVADWKKLVEPALYAYAAINAAANCVYAADATERLAPGYGVWIAIMNLFVEMTEVRA